MCIVQTGVTECGLLTRWEQERLHKSVGGSTVVWFGHAQQNIANAYHLLMFVTYFDTTIPS